MDASSSLSSPPRPFKLQPILEAQLPRPDISLAESIVTVLNQYDPVLLNNFLDPSIESIELSNAQFPSSHGWQLHIMRTGTIIRFAYVDGFSGHSYEYQWRTDDALGNWLGPLKIDGSVVMGVGLSQSKAIAHKIILNRSWVGTVPGRTMTVKAPLQTGH